MLLLYFMDGVKFEMMKKCMPFLSSLNSIPLQSEFGYSCACHATMYTSRYIDEHGTWFIWKKGNNSPYKWINFVPGLKFCNFLPIKLLIAKLTRKFSKNTSYSGVSCLVNLPLKYWDMFEPCDKVMWNDPCWKSNFPNLFSILKKKNIKHQIVALHRGTKDDDFSKEEKNVDYKENQFIYYFIGYTDNIMHKYGEKSQEAQKYFKNVDSFIRYTYDKAKSETEDVTLIAFSDHGHIDLEQPYIDINTFFKEDGLNVNNYIHLIESNYARFWFRNINEKILINKIINKLVSKGLGFVIDDECKKKYHLNVNPKEHGELIFYLKAPHEFTKTIWGFGHTVKSGHGFEPTLSKHLGFFCTNKNIVSNRQFAYLTDILPSVMEQLQISCDEITHRGKNIIRK